MSQYPTSNFAAPVPIEDQQATAARLNQQAGRGLFGLGYDAANSDWSASWAWRSIKGMAQPDDPNFALWKLDDNQFDRLTSGLDPDLWSKFDHAASMDHAVQIRDSMLGVQESRRNLSQAGWTGFGVRLLANVLDPPQVALGVATGGLSTAAMSGTRLARFTQLGLINAAAAAPIEAYIATQDPQYTDGDMVLSMGAAFLLGGGIGAVMPRAGKAAERMVKDAEYDGFVRAAMGASSRYELADPNAAKRALREKFMFDKGKAYLREQIIDAEGVDPLMAPPANPFDEAVASTLDTKTVSRAAIERRLTGAYEAMNLNSVVDDAAVDAIRNSLTYTARMKGEVDAIVAKAPWAKQYFREAGPGEDAGFEDLLAQIGEAGILRRLQDQGLSTEKAKLQRAKEFFLDNPQADPEAAFFAGIHDLLGGGGVRGMEIMDPSTMPAGTRFKIKGEKFEVVASENVNGEPVNVIRSKSGMVPDIEVDALRTPIPVDQFSAGGPKVARPKPAPKTAPNDTPREIWQIPLDEYKTKGLDPRPGAGRSPEDLQIIRDTIARKPGYLYHGTNDVDAAIGIETSGLEKGGLASDWRDTTDYSLHNGYIAVFRESDIPERFRNASLGDVALVPGWEPIKPIAVLSRDELGGLDTFGQRRMELGDAPEPPEFAHADAVKAAVERGDPVPADVLKDYPELAGAPSLDTAHQQAMRRAIDDILEASGIDDADELAYYRDLPPDVAAQRFAERHDPEFVGLPYDELPAPKPPAGEGPPLVDNAEPPAPPKKAGDAFLPPMGNIAKSAYPRMRFSIAGMVGQSKVGPVRWVAAHLFEDALNRADGSAAPAALTRWVRHTAEGYALKYERQLQASYRAWTKANNIPWSKRAEAFERFKADVSAAIETLNGPERHIRSIDPHVLAHAKVQSQLQGEMLEMMKRHGVKGAADVEADSTYLTTLWNPHLAQSAVATHGIDDVRRLFTEAIKSVNEELDDAAAERFGRHFVRVISNTDIDPGQKMRLFAMDRGELTEMLGEFTDLSADEIADMADLIAPPKKDANVNTRLKRRTRLPKDHTITTAAGTLSLRDLRETDAQLLFHLYTRQTVGQSAMATMYKAMGKEVESFANMRAKLREAARASGIDPDRDRKFLSDLSKIEFGVKSVLGQRIYPDTTLYRMLHRARLFNYITTSGSFTLAQIPEMLAAAGEVGFRTMAQHMPGLRELARDAATGKVSGEFLNELEEIWPIAEGLAHPVIDRFDFKAAGDFGGATKLDRLLERGAKAASKYSGFEFVDRYAKTMMAGASVQRFIDDALSGTRPSPSRLAAMSLDDAMWDRIAGEIAKNVKTVDGVLAPGHKVRKININQWDPEVGSAFVNAIDRWSSRVIQSNDIGQAAMWMSNPLAKVLLQFRGFAIGAWEKQFLHRWQQRDVTAFLTASIGSLFGGLMYVGQTYLNGSMRADRDEFYAKRLTTLEIGKAAFQRGGFSSIMPGILDAANQVTGGDPIFTARNSGLSSSFLDLKSNPTGAAVAGVFDTVSNLAKDVRARAGLRDTGGDFTQKQAKQLLNLVPFHNVMGIKQVLDGLVSRLPETDQR